MDIGYRIKQRRLELGLSQEELATKCGYKSRSSINKIELARNLPLNKIEKMATALEVTPSYLMGWTDVVDYAENVSMDTNIIPLSKEEHDELEKFNMLIESLKLTHNQREQVVKYAQILKKMEEEEKKNPSDN